MQSSNRSVPPKSAAETHSPGAPEGLGVLFFIRLGFLWALSLVYLLLNEMAVGWRFDFVIAALIVFTVSHFFYQNLRSPAKLLAVSIVDFIAAGSYPFVFLGGSFPHMLFIGMIGISLFLIFDAKIIWHSWLGAMLVFWAIVNISTVSYGFRIDLVNVVSTYSFVIFGAFIGTAIRSSYFSRQETLRLYERLREYTENAEEMAATRERIRIARDIHDTVGHEMTVLLVQLQAARMLMPSDPDRSSLTLARCEQLARSALQQVRLSVRAIRDEDPLPVSLIESLRQLTSDFTEATGVRTDLTGDPEMPLLAPDVRLAFYRIVQEALTNAQRHGRATEVHIELSRTAGSVRLRVSDNGTGAKTAGEGFGLTNLRERMTELQGNVTYESPEGSGFILTAEIPLKEWTA